MENKKRSHHWNKRITGLLYPTHNPVRIMIILSAVTFILTFVIFYALMDQRESEQLSNGLLAAGLLTALLLPLYYFFLLLPVRDHYSTEQKETERQLLESEQLFSHLGDAAYDAIAVIDDKGILRYWNKAAEKMFGYYRNEILGKELHLLIAPQKYHEEYREKYIGFRKNGEGSVIDSVRELVAVKKDGTEFPIELSVASVKIHDEWNAVGIIRDITQRKKAEEKIQEFNKQLQYSNASKDKFFSIIAHDLRSPFHAVFGYVEKLLDAGDSIPLNKQKEFVLSIKKASKTAYDLLENLLQWSRSQTGTLQIKPEKIDLGIIAREGVYLLGSIAEQKSITLHNSVAEQTYAFADPNMIRTVLRNLLSNAVKFTPQNGDIWLTSEKDDSFVTISVRDSGVGISEHDQKKLFRIDVSFSTAGTQNEKGTGLGLLVCKEFVEKNKGSITVNSAPGKGSTFTVSLPVEESANNIGA